MLSPATVTTILRCTGLVLAVLGLTGIAQAEEWCAPGVPRHAPHPVTGLHCPVAGNINGTPLAIPAHYLSGPITFHGVDIWSVDSVRQGPVHSTLANRIDDFAIRIRQTNFRPIETQEDAAAYARLGPSALAQPPENRWLLVDFDARKFAGTGGDFHTTVQNWLKDDAHWGPYVNSEEQWGLVHFSSTRPPSSDFWDTQREFYYDRAPGTTFIQCINVVRSVSPHDVISMCDLHVLMADLGLYVSVGNIQVKDDLADWKRIESGIRAVLDSFIVK
jgi:hypothetical protein